MTGCYLVGIDVGGTFTDLTVFDADTGATAAFKALSNRADPDHAVLAALAKSGVAHGAIERMMHGTTVATNALLERRGAKTALVTTTGFRDVIELGRTTRLTPGSLYDPYFRKAPPLVPRRHRLTIDERVTPAGVVETAPDAAALSAVIAALVAEGIESVAVGLVNAYANPANEAAVVQQLGRAFEHVCGSAEVSNEAREYERFSTCVANAYVMPVMARYVGRLLASLRQEGYARPFFTMASHGGLLTDSAVARTPVRTMLSGPAGGLTAARHLMGRLGEPDFITCDVGGTSSDVALVHGGEFPLKRETILQGMIIRSPQLDIHTVGAGGGSLAHLDTGGSLLVGPESAGASPGPACYGLGGTQATVTDANVVLGRLGASQRLGATLVIDGELARAAVGRLAAAKGSGVEAMAEGIVRVANARMAAAIYEVSVARGYDPRDFALLPFGGAGPLHACELAEELGIARVVIPPSPGTFSAFGTLCSSLLKDRSRTVLQVLDGPAVDRFDALFEELAATLRGEFEAEGVDTTHSRAERQVDARYAGQAHELIISIPDGADAVAIRAAFEQAFQREYGRLDRGRAVEIVNLRVIASVPVQAPEFARPAARRTPGSPLGTRRVRAAGRDHDARVYGRDTLIEGQSIAGPCVIEEMSATAWVPGGWTGRVGALGEIALARAAPSPTHP